MSVLNSSDRPAARSKDAPEISVVIPVYKGEDCLEELWRRLRDALLACVSSYEIVFVEDCGGDNSWVKILELADRDHSVRGLRFSRNFGQHYGITAGIDHSRGDWIVVMDCDLQDRPEEIPRLYRKAREGFDVVLARRGKRKDGVMKRLSSGLFYRLFNYLADLKYDPEVGNFRIISRRVADSFTTMREQLRFFGGLIDWLGYPTASVDVKHAERYAGETTYTFSKLWKLAAETIIAYSDKPLRLVIRFGFLMSAAAFVGAIYYLAMALIYGSSVPGWNSLIISLYFIGGAIIAILGMLGVYLGKAFDQTKQRPLYVVMERVERP